MSRKDKATRQQYLSPPEEKALAEYMLRMAHAGSPLPVKSLRHLARTIRRQQCSLMQVAASNDVPLPGKNWPQAFYKRHPELRARRTKAIDRNRHHDSIHEKVSEWFGIMQKVLKDPVILPENVYNMDETGVMLSVLGSLKVLVDRDDLRTTRPSCVQRTLITAIECISADGRYLDPLIIWPAVTHRSTWTAYPTPGWHFACSKSGYTDTAISLYWVQHVFDPLTRSRAKGRPRLLINDGFGTHESLEVLTYCFQNNIVLCRLPSHTSHKLQPCDVGVFGLLKTAYREQVECLYRGGATTIGKQHFTSLYSKARQTAFTSRNIRSSWAKAGLFPFQPGRVLDEIQPAEAVPCETEAQQSVQVSEAADQTLRTPTTVTSFHNVRRQLESKLDRQDEQSRAYLRKITNAAEKVYADRALLFDENRLLFEQNNEKSMRGSTRATIVGRAKVMSYDDIVEAQRRRSEKELGMAVPHEAVPPFTAPVARMLSEADQEALEAADEIDAMGFAQYCHVLRLERS
ncbi:hypothetical protein CB0940_02607 [Cercospora beticola]|uniref:HTH CENPB-type domain-containing protein n=1 Tax=Cercospora beticola TaxID=122368 RepID=A0A2G5I3X4_CERBT|nr:hypothetical protein CB0940_02607 [Cercospora beticola]PIA99514.1 hypothetical protein CB0940_02607 [Cercospora beticola]